MLDWPGFLASETGQAILMGATALGTLLGAGWAAYKGITQGRPSSPAVANAIASANCRIVDLDAPLRSIDVRLAAIEKRLAVLDAIAKDSGAARETLIRIEDRTRGL